MMCPIENNQPISNQKAWEIALQWVSTHKKFVRMVASPYAQFMTGGREDLYQEAVIAAYKALIYCIKKDRQDQFIKYFRVTFKSNCIKLSYGIQTVHCLEDHILLVQDESQQAIEPKKGKISRALQSMSKRQRQICLWLLQQPTPVSTPDIARKFKISRRQACRLVSESIERISGA